MFEALALTARAASTPPTWESVQLSQLQSGELLVASALNFLV